MKRISLSVILLFSLVATLGCQHSNVSLLPKDLVGYWTTDEPQYADRFVELYRAYVIVGTGSKEVPQVQAVDSVEAKPDGDGTVYTISSSDLSGASYKMTLLYTPKRGGELRFRHMESMVWKRRVENNSQPQPAPATQKAVPPANRPKSTKSGR
jgi:hypothetical protein